MRSCPSLAAPRRVLQDYLAFYRATWAEGRLRLCNEAPLKSRSAGFQAGKWDVGAIAQSCWAKRRGRREAGAVFLRKLSQAFGYLELLCVNLCLSPWRKEIKSLKTFTGNFVYHVKSILPESVVQQLLSEIGYVATSATEYSLVRKLSEEEAENNAFEMFLARVECENLLEIAGDMKDGDLADILQKRAQEHCLPCIGLTKKQERSQTKENVAIGESNGDAANPALAYLSHSQSAFKEQDKIEHGKSFGLQCITMETQPAASKQTPEQDRNQNQTEETSTHSCIRSTDSEDFLIKYSDIVIGQQPLHFSTSSPRAANEEAWLTETRLGLPTRGEEALPRLPSEESGPQALAILNDSTVASQTPYDYQTLQATKESKICDAMKRLGIPGSDTVDEPKELKGSPAQQSPNSSNDLALMVDKPKNKEDYLEKLMYPVEETAQPESARSPRVPEERYHPEMKSADFSSGDNDNVDLYSSDHFSHIAGCRYPTLGPSYSRHLDDPILTCPVPAEDQYCGDIPSGIRHRRERCPLHSSLADLDTRGAHGNEPSLDGYVVIKKDD